MITAISGGKDLVPVRGPGGECLVEGTDTVWERRISPGRAGAYTGEVSPVMLKELCRYVILGHRAAATW